MALSTIEIKDADGNDQQVVVLDSPSGKAQVQMLAFEESSAVKLVNQTDRMPVHDDVLGTTADAAASSDAGTFTLNALMKRLVGKIPGFGQAAAATSLPVVIASDQSALGVLGVRRDADTAISGDGTGHPFVITSAGRLKVSTAPADLAVTTGSITTNGGLVAVSVARLSNLAISMAATSLVGHNAAFECSNNSTNGTDGNWYSVQAIRTNANTVETATGVLAATPAYMWEVNVSAYQWFRVRATAHTSGTAAYVLSPSAYATEPIPAQQLTAAQAVTLAALPALVAGNTRIGYVASSGIWWDDSSSALGASATFTGTARDLIAVATATQFNGATSYGAEFRVSAESDVTGTLWIDASRDGSTWRRVKSQDTTAVAAGGFYAELVLKPSWRYARVGFTNGAGAQARFTIGSVAVAD